MKNKSIKRITLLYYFYIWFTFIFVTCLFVQDFFICRHTQKNVGQKFFLPTREREIKTCRFVGNGEKHEIGKRRTALEREKGRNVIEENNK
jgi:hypothetical protein